MKFIKYGIAIIMSGFFSLSALAHDVTDGNMNYCETVMNLETETVEMTFYPF